jgi:hypothetical protein
MNAVPRNGPGVLHLEFMWCGSVPTRVLYKIVRYNLVGVPVSTHVLRGERFFQMNMYKRLKFKLRLNPRTKFTKLFITLYRY